MTNLRAADFEAYGKIIKITEVSTEVPCIKVVGEAPFVGLERCDDSERFKSIHRYQVKYEFNSVEYTDLVFDRPTSNTIKIRGYITPVN